MKFTLRQIETFQAVAELQHFGRAATQLKVAQPTVSKEIRALERALGIQLFHRRGRATGITADGAALLNAAAAVMEAAAGLERTASSLAEESQGALSLAVSPSISNRLGPRLLRRLEDVAPALQVKVLDVETGRVEAAVTDGSADLGIGHDLRPAPGCSRGRLATSSLVLYGAEELIRSVESPDDLSVLAQTPLLLWPRENNPSYFDRIMAICGRRRLDPLLIIGGSRLSGSRGYLLEEGRAFSVIPADFAQAHAQSYPGRFAACDLGADSVVSLDAMWQEPPSTPVLQALEIAQEILGDESW